MHNDIFNRAIFVRWVLAIDVDDAVNLAKSKGISHQQIEVWLTQE
jgi:hypothetical protein